MRRLLAIVCLPLSVTALAACGATTTTAPFSGVRHEAAQAIANLQSDATAAEEKKICANDLAATIVRRLGGASGCEAAIKRQLEGVDNLEVSIQSVDVAADGTTATAAVTSIHEGKSRSSTVSLVKEGGRWKISGL